MGKTTEILKQEYSELVIRLAMSYWRYDFWMNENQMRKVIRWKASMNVSTAEKILEAVQQYSRNFDLKLEDLFYVENLRWNSNALERSVEYEYWVNPLSKRDIADLVKYIFERNLRWFWIMDLLIVVLIISLIWSWYYIYLYYQHYR